MLGWIVSVVVSAVATQGTVHDEHRDHADQPAEQGAGPAPSGEGPHAEQHHRDAHQQVKAVTAKTNRITK